MVFVPPHYYINWVKNTLNRFGAGLTVNGVADDTYRARIEGFQASEKIGIDGKVGRQTQDRLIRANHNNVAYAAWVREMLRSASNMANVGSGGPLSETDRVEIRLFQEYRGQKPDGRLGIDGWVGPQTEMVLREFAKADPVPQPAPEFPRPVPPKKDPQPTKDQIKAMTYVILGRTPGGTTWQDVAKMAFDAGSLAVEAAEAADVGMPLTWDMIRDGLAQTDKGLAGIAFTHGMAYSVMDTATGRHRSGEELDHPDLGHSGAPAFRSGYNRMKRQLWGKNAYSEPYMKGAMEQLRQGRDPKWVVQTVHDGIMEVCINDPMLAGNVTVQVHRYCLFDYGAMKVRCGPNRPMHL